LDIMFLLERLESQIATGTGVPRTRKVLVDKDAVLDLIDQLRVAVPEEVHAAKRINAEGERIIEKANEEAGRIAARAQEQAAYLIGERGLTETAEAEGRRILDQAQRVADDVRLGADEYAAEILEGLESEVRKALAGIEKGIGVLDMRRAELRGDDALATPAGTAAAGDDRFADDDDDDRTAPKDMADWPSTVEDAVLLREEDAGQTVSR
jgi:cell division septum initiation protein DivIVA